MMQVDLCCIVDGNKVLECWKIIEQVECVYVDEWFYDFLYEDSEGYYFMELESYVQVVVVFDVVGDDKVFLEDGICVFLQVYNDVVIVIELFQCVIVEVVEIELVVKGQIVLFSYKFVIVYNGVCIMVLFYIGVGIKVIINIEDLFYVECVKV